MRMKHKALLAALALSTSAGQTSLSWTYRKIQVPPESGVVHIVMTEAPASGEYVVGVKAGARTDWAFVVGGAVVGPRSHQIRLPSSIGNWPAANVLAAPGWLRIRSVPDPHRVLIVYGIVEAGTVVEIDGPAGSIATAGISPTRTLLVEDGAVVAVPVTGMGTLFHRIIRPAGPSAPVKHTEAIPWQHGRYMATPDALAVHIRRFAQPFPPRASVSKSVHDRRVVSALAVPQTSPRLLFQPRRITAITCFE